MSPDLLGLAGDVPTDDGDEPGTEGVVEDQPQADNTTCGHDLSTVLYEIYQGRQ